MTEHELLSFIKPKRYHSCVILGYSFDPIFFDKIVYPSLKRAGIINVVVLVDYLMLEQSLAQLLSNDFSKSEGYSVCGIRSESAFHPKVIQLFGEKHGLLYIGSGNPTYGGYSRNLEIWFTSSIDNASKENGRLFKDLFTYIKSNTAAVRGIVRKKLDWIEQYSPWLDELPSGADEFDFLNKTEGILLLNSRTGIYSRLKKIIGREKIKVINIHSPFYDSKFSALKKLYVDFTPTKINILIQPEYVSLNPKSINSLPKEIVFYDANELLKKQGNSTHRYIHAKLIEFQGTNNSFLLFGSANLSLNALGTDVELPKNEEASLLIRSNKRKSFFESLSISPENKDRISHQELLSRLNEYPIEESEKKLAQNHYRYHITGIDRFKNYYEVFIAAPLSDDIVLVVQDVNGKLIDLIEEYEVKEGKGFKTISFKKLSRSNTLARFGYLCDRKKRPISNKALVHNIQDLGKSNPSQRHRDIQVVLSTIEMEYDQLWELFSLLEPGEYITKDIKPAKVGTRHTDAKNDTEEGPGEVLSYEDFTAIEDSQIKTIGVDYLIGQSTLTEVIDVMNRLLTTFETKKEERQADEEETEDIESSEGESENEEEWSDTPITLNFLSTNRKKAIKYLRKFTTLFKDRYNVSNSLPQQFFAMHAITTYLLMYFSLRKFRIGNTTEYQSIIPLLSQDDNEDFVNYGLDVVGLMYSKLARERYYDSDIIKYEDSILKEIKFSALNSITILSIISYIVPRKTSYDYVEAAIRLEFLNVLDITERNSVKIKKEEFIAHIRNFFRLTAHGDVKEEKILETFERRWSIYKSTKITDKLVAPNEVQRGVTYYSIIDGFVTVNAIYTLAARTIKATCCIPGVRRDDEAEGYTSKGYHLPPANLYKVVAKS